MKTLKAITIYALKRGYLLQDPFRDHHFHLAPVDRGFLTDEEILRIANKEQTISRLELVRDLFLFSCFIGLAYIKEIADLCGLQTSTLQVVTIAGISTLPFLARYLGSNTV